MTDLVDYLKQNPDVDIEKEFKGSMTHDEFEQSLNDIGFDISKQNLEKLKEAFINTKEPDKISKNLMKRNINFLAPEILNKDKGVEK